MQNVAHRLRLLLRPSGEKGQGQGASYQCHWRTMRGCRGYWPESTGGDLCGQKGQVGERVDEGSERQAT